MPAITDRSHAAKVGIRINAPAKINLTLHVTGQRADGYHLLDSLVTFAACGDELRMEAGTSWSLTAEGPEAAEVPADNGNLVLKVARLFDDMPGASFLLTKNLPLASGIGGGSADAAAAYRGLICHRNAQTAGDNVPEALFAPDRSPLAAQLLALGADIPACLLSRTVRMQGIGGRLTEVPDLPRLFAVLVNPRCQVSTPDIFNALRRKDNSPMPAEMQRFTSAADLALWLREQRNDLEPPASEIEPAIPRVLAGLSAADGCLVSRMSGSGATCFGLFSEQSSADAAGRQLQADHPDWWVCSTRLGTMTDLAMPRFS